MKRLLSILILVPTGILVVLFAVANRKPISVGFDPFAPDMPAFAVSMPLYAFFFIVLLLGILIGGTATWVGQGRFRRNARLFRAEAQRFRSEADRMRAEKARESGLPALLLPGRTG